MSYKKRCAQPTLFRGSCEQARKQLLDEKRNRIPATGIDGSNGANGKNGNTPLLKIEDGFWYVSYDGGSTWKEEPLGPGISECHLRT